MSVRTFTSTETGPRARGVEFGRANAPEVRRTAAAYADLFARKGAPGFDVRRWATAFRAAVGDLDPDALAEIDGIAEGAGADPLDVVAINARTEILAKADPYGERECSTVLVVPPDGPAYAVQTWDWYAAFADGWLRWRVPQADGGWLETVTEYGLLAKIGVSSRGVGVMLNMLHHESDDNDDVGFPVHLLSRQVLAHAASYDAGERICRDASVCASTSLTVLDADGGASIELFPKGPGVVQPTDGVLVRTNHFVSAEGREGCLTYATNPSTRLRLDHLERTLRGTRPTGPDDVLAALRHHDAEHDEEGAVCRHPEPGIDPAVQTATLATVVVRPGAPGFEVSAGGPCGRG